MGLEGGIVGRVEPQAVLPDRPPDATADIVLREPRDLGLSDAPARRRPERVTREEAQDTLQRAAKAGLVHPVNNSQNDVWYICNCCTCSCGILRGMKEMRLANVVARSAFVNSVDEDLCIGCENCVSACQFEAISYDQTAKVDARRCVGCGVCVVACSEGALSLIRRADMDVTIPPVDEDSWRVERAKRRGKSLEAIL